MTLSAVSMQMKALEADLGVTLFDRAFRPPRLTPVGRAVAGHAGLVLQAEEDLLRACDAASRLTGRVRVGFIGTASVRLLPDVLRRAGRLVPGVEFAIETGLSEDLDLKVRQGRLDAAVITLGREQDPSMDYTVLRSEPLAYAIPRSVGSLEPSQLIDRAAFLQFMPTTGIGKLISRHVGRLADGRPVRAQVIDGIEAIMECVKAGLGFTVLPLPDIERYADPRVAIVRMDPDRPPGALSREIGLCLRADGPLVRHRAELIALFGSREPSTQQGPTPPGQATPGMA